MWGSGKIGESRWCPGAKSRAWDREGWVFWAEPLSCGSNINWCVPHLIAVGAKPKCPLGQTCEDSALRFKDVADDVARPMGVCPESEFGNLAQGADLQGEGWRARGSWHRASRIACIHALGKVGCQAIDGTSARLLMPTHTIFLRHRVCLRALSDRPQYPFACEERKGDLGAKLMPGKCTASRCKLESRP